MKMRDKWLKSNLLQKREEGEEQASRKTFPLTRFLFDRFIYM